MSLLVATRSLAPRWMGAVATTLLAGALVGTSSCSGAPPQDTEGAPGESVGQTSEAVMQGFASGSLIIPMDNTYQNNGMFRAYGLAYQLLLQGVPVYWAVNSTKAVGGNDFTATTKSFFAPGAAIGTVGYKAGPFVVDAADVAKATPFINAWRTANPNVNVHAATAAFTADVNRKLVSAPRIAVFLDGNELIAFGYLNAAGIRDSKGQTWPTVAAAAYAGYPDILSPAQIDGPTTTNHADGALLGPTGQPAYCNIASMHYPTGGAAVDNEVVAEVRNWLGKPGTHLYAECLAVNTFESNANGRFLDANGFAAASAVQPGAATLLQPTSPFAQFDGTFGTVTGAAARFSPAAGSTLYATSSMLMQQTGATGSNNLVYLTGYMDNVPTNGKVSYLAGHQYSVALPMSTNPTSEGTRLFLNGIFESPCAAPEGQPTVTLTKAAPAGPTNASTVTFTLSYANAGPGVALASVLTDTLPTGATYVSSTPGGAYAGGKVTWSLGDLGKGAAGSVSVTVSFAASGSYANTGAVTFAVGNSSKTVTSNTTNTAWVKGCLLDTDCSTAQFCNTQTNICTPKLANGAPVPTITGHAPPLTGTCSAAVGTAVCVNGVCDTADNDCGYKNGDGPCTLVDAGAVCRSQVCDPDLKCGYANGDGPCTAATAASVCRSGACSVAGVCQAAGACTVDGDCTSSQFCNTQTKVCVAKLANGVAIPTITGHAPALTGACSAPVATAVCTSAVCDTADNECGYKNGDGACTTANAGTVCRSGVCDPDGKCGFADGDGPCAAATGPALCRSGACSTSGLCEPVGGCLVDGDCSTTQFCDTAAKKCVPKLANGASVPTIAGHAPPLTGACSAPVGVAVCAAAVCDGVDNACGYLNGDGSCTAATAGTVCRSGACGADGKCGLAVGEKTCTTVNAATICRSGACSSTGACEPAGGCLVDGDCAADHYCDTPTLKCAPKLANGSKVPTVVGHAPPVTGTCTVAAGGVACLAGVCDTADDACGFKNGDGACDATDGPKVCRSAVCDADGKCGYADGDGPCTSANAATVCRSGGCSVSGVCQAPGACVVDGDCATTQFCDTASKTCTPKLANGTAVPTIAGHAPPLTGTCNAAVGSAVCQAGVCDTADNGCGYKNGDGTCTSATAATVCRSGVCSASGVCAAPGGCSIDADCASTEFCDTGASKCTTKLANGTAIPTIAGHTPPLAATCTAPVASAVCASAVCDTLDNRCGYANGDGACTAATSTTVCRSGACDADGKCGLANGDGPCTTANGGTLCRSLVCDTDGKCGLADGDGPCTVANGATLCRSTVCGTAGTCVPATGCTVDGDCTTAQFCDTSKHSCTDKLANGTAIPSIGGHAPALDGKCSAAESAVVCVSGVCDAVDDACGLADGDGPCTSANGGSVCRSGACNGTVCGGGDAGPDAGPDAGDAGDAGESGGDAGDDAGADTSGTVDGGDDAADATIPDAQFESPEKGTIEGGGCDLGHTGGGDAGRSGLAGVLVAGVAALIARRRRAA